jgi:hypothetical protein
VFGRLPTDKMEGGLFATSLWSYLTNLDSPKIKNQVNFGRKKERWMFDNAIITDGVSVSFQIIKASEFGRKERYKKTTTQEEKVLTTIPTDKSYLNDPATKLLSVDPGKRDILAVSDGKKTVCYTLGKRNNDIYLKTRADYILNRRRSFDLDKFESTKLNQFSKRSCQFDTFKNFCQCKIEKDVQTRGCYNYPSFRQFKFLVYCKVKSSEHKFMAKIKKAFQPENKTQSSCCSKQETMNVNASKQSKQLVLGWGNWGKNPNALKNSAPTPGIGIRNRFESFFKTETIDEHFTSQTCPCCKNRTLKAVDFVKETFTIHKHHLLRCTNELCHSRWWNRNVVGSFNILERILNLVHR